jgi:tricarballylate dehydrogenase
VRLTQDRKGAVVGVTVKGPDGYEDIHARAVVLACGGFEAKPGDARALFRTRLGAVPVRGTRHNTGDGIKAALDIGAQPFGGWSTCHAVQWDISAPPFGDRVVLDNYQKHSYPIGIVVNMNGERFIDEGADYPQSHLCQIRPRGHEAAAACRGADLRRQNHRMVRDEYRIRQVTKAEANTHRRAGKEAGDQRRGTGEAHGAEFNAACQPGDYNPSILDGKGTKGITPPKSNWALPIDKPPYHGFMVTCGITFTFGGLRINTNGEVLDLVDRRIPGLYAAGELVGGIFYQNYLGGAGLMSGAVFGRLAGQSAGRQSKYGRPITAAHPTG